jgi:hypothetical protein
LFFNCLLSLSITDHFSSYYISSNISSSYFLPLPSYRLYNKKGMSCGSLLNFIYFFH